jgi:hypothetical protein
MAISARVIALSVCGTIAIAVVTFFATAGGAESDSTSLRPLVLKHETLIADCMHHNGFDYVVSVPTDVVAAEAANKAAQNGQDKHAAIGDAQRHAPANPNDALVAKLSPERQQAWGDALFGTDTSTGCYYGTYQEAWGVDLGAAAARGEQHLARVKADPAVKAAERRYIDCMAARGYRVTTTEEIFGQVAQQRETVDNTAAEALTESATAAHTACVGPYSQVFDEAYVRLNPR